MHKVVDNVKHNTCVTLFSLLPCMLKVKLIQFLIHHRAVKTSEGKTILFLKFLALALVGDDWPASSSGCFSFEQRTPGTREVRLVRL